MSYRRFLSRARLSWIACLVGGLAAITFLMIGLRHVAAAPPAAQHVEFVDGVGDYAGLQYTTIGYDISLPFGGSGPFVQIVDRLPAAPDGRERGWHNGLIRFTQVLGCDLGQIPPHAIINSAQLRLRLIETTLAGGVIHNSPDFIQNVQVYGLRSSFDENTATWIESAAGVSWEEPGGWGLSDRNPLPDDAVVATLLGDYVWDITHSLQEQVDQDQEFGWMLLSPDALARDGDNTRWFPQALVVDFVSSILTYTGDTSAWSSQPLQVSALLTDPNGQPVANAPVTFALGAQQVTANTGPTGVASTQIPVDLAPGTYTLNISTPGVPGGVPGACLRSTILVEANRPPMANAGGPYSGLEDSPIPLSGSGSDPDGDPLNYSWTYVVGSSAVPGATCLFADSSVPTTTITCTDNGEYTVTLTVDDGVNPPVSDSAIVTVLTPQQATGHIIADVETLVTTGVLNQGQGNALIAKLDAAIRQMDRGNANAAINQLQAFVNQVNALINEGILSPVEGQPLLDAANEIIIVLQG